jgi:two-component system, sensor histidine kinase and response regulator
VPLFSPAGTINGVLAMLHKVSQTIAQQEGLSADKEEVASSRDGVFKRNSKEHSMDITSNTSERKKKEFLIRENEARLLELNQELESQVAARTAELSRKNQQLLRINTDLDNFIYTASHDLKAPIANLEGLLNLLDGKIKEALSERELDLLHMMYQSIGRFKRTIKDLTDIAQLQKELEQETAETVSLPLLLDEIKADISQLLESCGAQLRVNLQLEEFGYSSKNLRSVLHNLITNAIKYRQPDVPLQLAIDCCRLGGYIQMRIADNGQGIPEKHQDKIFSLFKRLHKDVEGSGMGLYIVKRIVENSGGRIEVDSAVGKGTTFTLYLKDLALYEK